MKTKKIKEIWNYPKRILIYKFFQILRNKSSKNKILRDNGYLPKPLFIKYIETKTNRVHGLIQLGLENFFIKPWEKDTKIQLWKKLNPNRHQQILAAADDICHHKFHFPDFNFIATDNFISWNREFLQGKEWPKTYYLNTDYLDISEPSDVKTTWELNRFQYVINLGLAYLITENPKYVIEFAKQIDNWIEQNPTCFSINWTSAMEVSIRAINWIWALFFFYPSKVLSDSFLERFIHSLLEHGEYIAHNLEYGKNSGNHLLANALGLIYLGFFFPGYSNGKRWAKVGQSIIWNELNRQVYDDGVHFERTAGYHGIVSEIYLHAIALSGSNKIRVPKAFYKKFAKMIEFMQAYTKPDGSYPRIGDCDDGCIVQFDGQKVSQKHLIDAGRYLLYKNISENSDYTSVTRFWLISDNHERLLDENYQASSHHENPIGSKFFNNGGYVVMREGEFYFCMNAGDLEGRGPGSHVHHDLFTFELSIGSINFIIDSGTYRYTSSKQWRYYFRRNAAHNVLTLKDADSRSPIKLDSPFPVDKKSNYKVTGRKWITAKKYDFFEGIHDLFSPLNHKRSVLFDKTEIGWLIKDELNGEGNQESSVLFHFNPDISEFTRKSEGKKIIYTGSDTEWNLFIKLCEGKESYSTKNLKIKKNWSSKIYGCREIHSVAKFSGAGILPHKYLFALVPFKGPYADNRNELIKKVDTMTNRLLNLKSGA